jgi:hypothetical protein
VVVNGEAGDDINGNINGDVSADLMVVSTVMSTAMSRGMVMANSFMNYYFLTKTRHCSLVKPGKSY